MAYTETGFSRSMRLIITKTGDDGSVINTTYDGQGAFGGYQAIASDDDFRRLERNGVDGGWDNRFNAFKAYVLGEIGQDAYSVIDWLDCIRRIEVYVVKFMQIADSQAKSVVASVYKNGVRADAPEDLTILFDLPVSKNIGLIIPAHGNLSDAYYIQNQSDGDISTISNIRITPQYSIDGSYGASLDMTVKYDTSTGQVVSL